MTQGVRLFKMYVSYHHKGARIPSPEATGRLFSVRLNLHATVTSALYPKPKDLFLASVEKAVGSIAQTHTNIHIKWVI